MPSKMLCKRSSKRLLKHLRPRRRRHHLRNLSLNFRRHRLRLHQTVPNQRRLCRLQGLTHILVPVPLIMDMGLLSSPVKRNHRRAWVLDMTILLTIVRALQDLPILADPLSAALSRRSSPGHDFNIIVRNVSKVVYTIIQMRSCPPDLIVPPARLNFNPTPGGASASPPCLYCQSTLFARRAPSTQGRFTMHNPACSSL